MMRGAHLLVKLQDSEYQRNFGVVLLNMFSLKPSMNQAELQYEEQFQLYVV